VLGAAVAVGTACLATMREVANSKPNTSSRV